MSDVERLKAILAAADLREHQRQLRQRAAACRRVAAVPTNGGHESDRLLRDIATQLEREADELTKEGS